MQMKRTIHLKKLDLMSSVAAADSVVVLIIGRRSTGKSVLAMDVLRAAGFVGGDADPAKARGAIFSPTDACAPFYGPAFADAPGVRVFVEYSPSWLPVDDGGSGGDEASRSFVVLDNCMYNSDWANGREINELFANARRTRTTVVLTIPYPLGLPPFMQSYVDYVFMLREHNVSCLRRLREQYAPVFEDLDTFFGVMDDVTQDQGACVVIDNAPKSSQLEDHVFWYAAVAIVAD